MRLVFRGAVAFELGELMLLSVHVSAHAPTQDGTGFHEISLKYVTSMLIVEATPFRLQTLFCAGLCESI